jgi:hypothetical protein
MTCLSANIDTLPAIITYVPITSADGLNTPKEVAQTHPNRLYEGTSWSMQRYAKPPMRLNSFSDANLNLFPRSFVIRVVIHLPGC